MLKWLLPYIPKALVWPIASQYIAGETLEQCIATGCSINTAGSSLAIDILGEHSKSQLETDHVVDAYRQLIQSSTDADLDFSISLKLSHLGVDADRKMGESAIKTLLEFAKRYDTRVTLDMESSKMTDLTLDIYSTFVEQYSVGVVLQSYLLRSLTDAENLVANHDPQKLHIRVCKGIYKEPAHLVFDSRDAISNNYIDLATYLYDSGTYVCIATHDAALMDHFASLKWDPSRFEFQALLGVPIEQKMKALREAGYKTTIYLPYGPDWHAYSIRRLMENPKLIRYVIRNMFN